MEPAEVPDVYADAASVASGKYGFALTFLLTEPPLEGQGGGQRVVARVRLSTELARAVATAVAQATVALDAGSDKKAAPAASR